MPRLRRLPTIRDPGDEPAEVQMRILRRWGARPAQGPWKTRETLARAIEETCGRQRGETGLADLALGFDNGRLKSPTGRQKSLDQFNRAFRALVERGWRWWPMSFVRVFPTERGLIARCFSDEPSAPNPIS